MRNHSFLKIDEVYIEQLERHLENSRFPILESDIPFKKDVLILFKEVKRLEELLERLADLYVTEKWEFIDEINRLKNTITALQNNGQSSRRIIKSKSIDNRHEST